MLQEADRLKVPPHGRAGGLILDEMAIQEDLQFMRSGDVYKLCGLTQMGVENENWRELKQGNGQPKLANHVLQIHFLDKTGFRFPIAHFPTTQATAVDLNGIFWDAVENIESYGFVIEYTNMDGAITNRQFLKMNFPPKAQSQQQYCAISPVCPQQKIIFMMDYSHGTKKIRNSIYSSGSGGTRFLTYGAGDIVWKYWRQAYEWDSSNPIQIHRKLTRNHIELDNCAKVRNHLAEQVLDDDMQYLMCQFQQSLSTNVLVLDPTLLLLEQNSKMIKIFRDARPITHIEDPRLQQLKQVYC